MNIDRKRLTDIEKYTLILALLYYVFCVFIYKSMPYGLIFVLTVGFFALFHLDFYKSHLKLAALNHLLPLVIACLTYGRPMEKYLHHSELPNFLAVLILSLVPFLLLIFGKTNLKPSKEKTIPVVKVRIVVQITIFTLYAGVSAYTWIMGTKTELLFWGLVNVLTVALLPFLFGRAICGWICPNCTIQDGLYKHLEFKRPISKLPQAIESQSRSSAMNISGEIDKRAPYLPFTLLLVWFPMFFLETVFDLTPKMWYDTGFLYGLVILSLFFPWRKFCAYFCWFSSYRCLASNNSIWKVRFNQQNCKNCRVCLAEEACPFQIDIRNQTEMPATCCLCFNCKNACPGKDVFTFGTVRSLKDEETKLKECES